MDAIEAGKHGLMTAISDGCYAMVPIPDPKLGPRKVDVATMYNTERYRPIYDQQARPADLPYPRLIQPACAGRGAPTLPRPARVRSTLRPFPHPAALVPRFHPSFVV